jgi:hypothetical protein
MGRQRVGAMKLRQQEALAAVHVARAELLTASEAMDQLRCTLASSISSQHHAAKIGERLLGGTERYRTGDAVGSKQLYRTVTALARDLGSAESALEAAIAKREFESTEVAEIYMQSLQVERLVGAASRASSDLMETLRAGTTDDDARIRKAFNTGHLRGLILGGVQLRTAAKDFLEAVLVNSNDLAISAEDVYVADAGDMGQGLFAAREISPGRKIGEYMGERLDREELLAKYGLEASECADYVMQIGEDMWMDASDPAKSNHTRYINHAEGEAENCVMFGDDKSSTIILVIRPVACGEQLLMNYGPGYWSSRNITPNAPRSAASYGDTTGNDDASTLHGPVDARRDSAPSSSPSSSSSSSSPPSSSPPSSSSTPHAASDSYADQGRGRGEGRGERGEGRGERESSLSDIQARARAPMDERAHAPLLSDRAGVAADEKQEGGRKKVRDQVVGGVDYTFRHFVRGTTEASVRIISVYVNIYIIYI